MYAFQVIGTRGCYHREVARLHRDTVQKDDIHFSYQCVPSLDHLLLRTTNPMEHALLAFVIW